MPLDSKHLLKPDVALDALLKASDLQQHVLKLHGWLLQLQIVHSFEGEENAPILHGKISSLGTRIVADLRTIQTDVTHLEKILSGQDPFPPPPRRHRRTAPSPIPNPREED